MQNQNVVKQILQEAKQLLIDKGWTKGCFVRDVNGLPTYMSDPTATCFCTLGAVNRVRNELSKSHTPDQLYDAADEAKLLLQDSPHQIDIADFNDDPSTTKEMVLELFDKAIVKA